MTTYSVSRVKTFLENPWKHWCKYLAGYKEKQDPEVTQYMDRGTYSIEAWSFQHRVKVK